MSGINIIKNMEKNKSKFGLIDTILMWIGSIILISIMSIYIDLFPFDLLEIVTFVTIVSIWSYLLHRYQPIPQLR